MRGKMMFAAGAAVGFVLGTRAGRERYENIVAAAKKLMESPTVHEATGVAKSQASKLYSQGKDAIGNSRLRHPKGKRDDVDGFFDEQQPQRMTSNSF